MAAPPSGDHLESSRVRPAVAHLRGVAPRTGASVRRPALTLAAWTAGPGPLGDPIRGRGRRVRRASTYCANLAIGLLGSAAGLGVGTGFGLPHQERAE